MKNPKSIRSIVLSYAHTLKAQFGFGEAQRMAWAYFKSKELICFRKKSDNSIQVRRILKLDSANYEAKGTRKVSEAQKRTLKFFDVDKLAKGLPRFKAIISIVPENLIQVA